MKGMILLLGQAIFVESSGKKFKELLLLLF